MHDELCEFVPAIFLTLSGGFQDAYTYFCRGGVFANAQTGNIVLMATALFRGDFWGAAKYLVPLAAFLLGIAAAVAVRVRFGGLKRLSRGQVVLLLEIVLLFAVGLIPAQLDSLANAVVSFVCAMQVQTFRSLDGKPYAGTMCIGNMRSAAAALCSGERKTALMYFIIIAVFAVGAGAGGVLSGVWGDTTVWLCCGLLMVAFGLMFIKKPTDTAHLK